MTAPIHIISISLFVGHPAIQRCVVRGTDSVVKPVKLWLSVVSHIELWEMSNSVNIRPEDGNFSVCRNRKLSVFNVAYT
jgi:hypothetical protein